MQSTQSTCPFKRRLEFKRLHLLVLLARVWPVIQDEETYFLSCIYVVHNSVCIQQFVWQCLPQYMYVCLSVSVCVCVHERTRVCVYVCLRVHLYFYVSMCACLYIYVFRSERIRMCPHSQRCFFIHGVSPSSFPLLGPKGTWRDGQKVKEGWFVYVEMCICVCV